MVSTPRPLASAPSDAPPSRPAAPSRGVEVTSPVSGRETATCEASAVVPPAVDASQVGDVSDLLLAEIETRRLLALDEHKAITTTLDTLAVAGITLTGPDYLALRRREQRFGSLASQLQDLGYRLQRQQMHGVEEGDTEITRRSEAWLCQARKTEWRELDARCARAMQDRAYFRGAPW